DVLRAPPAGAGRRGGGGGSPGGEGCYDKSLIRREIVLDEKSNEILESLAVDNQGDASLVIRELLRMHGLRESDVDSLEALNADATPPKAALGALVSGG